MITNYISNKRIALQEYRSLNQFRRGQKTIRWKEKNFGRSQAGRIKEIIKYYIRSLIKRRKYEEKVWRWENLNARSNNKRYDLESNIFILIEILERN